MTLVKKFALPGLFLVCFIWALPISCVAGEDRVQKKNGKYLPELKTEENVDPQLLEDLDLFLDLEMIHLMEVFEEEEETQSEQTPGKPEETP